MYYCIHFHLQHTNGGVLECLWHGAARHSRTTEISALPIIASTLHKFYISSWPTKCAMLFCSAQHGKAARKINLWWFSCHYRMNCESVIIRFNFIAQNENKSLNHAGKLTFSFYAIFPKALTGTPIRSYLYPYVCHVHVAVLCFKAVNPSSYHPSYLH